MEGVRAMQKNFWQEFKKPFLALAPMAGISDAAFRLLCRKHGADVVYTERIPLMPCIMMQKKL
ncbi:MAG: tRNA-dihydrouridine synthase [Parcubacteria group bacterium GW2011_GWC2_38_7]|nr:MAG: tRNA-dihydrouridine synthase [Parcubacteria group bacterium GW2011_GWC2_38_7]